MMEQLPAGWSQATLGDIAETRLGKMLSAKARVSTSPRPYLRNKNVQWGRIDISDMAEMDFADDEVERFTVLPDDVLVCEGGDVGRTAVWKGQLPWVGYQKALHRIRPARGVSSEYLAYFMRWFASVQAFEPYATGSTIKHLPQENLRLLPVPVPPEREQRAIVSVIEEQFSRLDAADLSLRVALRRLHVLRNELLSFAIADGEERVLGELLEGIEAGRSFKCHGRPAGDEEWGVIKVSAMTWGAFDESQNKAVLSANAADARWEIRPGDLLLSRANTTDYVGATVLVGPCRPRLLLSDKSMRLLVKSACDKGWLRHALSASRSRAQMSAVATGTSDSMRNISQDKVKKIKLRVPTLDDQRRIAAELDRRLTLVAALAAGVERARHRGASLRRSILEHAFSGKFTQQNQSDEPASALLERIVAQQAAGVSRNRAPVSGRRQTVGAS